MLAPRKKGSLNVFIPDFFPEEETTSFASDLNRVKNDSSKHEARNHSCITNNINLVRLKKIILIIYFLNFRSA